MAESTAPEKMTRKTTSLPQLLTQRVQDTPDREAYRYPVGEEWRSMTWRQAGERIKAIAAGLLSLGLHREERVGILSNTRVEWLLCDLGILCAGGATTTVYPSSTPEDCAFILADSDTRYIFVEDNGQVAKLRAHKAEMPKLAKLILIDGAAEAQDGDWVMTLAQLEQRGAEHLAKDPRAVDEVVAGVEGKQLATLIYTSGTTGKPKGVRLLHECWAYTADAIDAIKLWGPDDVQYLWLPMSHSFGKVLMAGHIASGSVTAVDGRIPKIVENLAVVRPTIMAAVPRIFEKVYNKILEGVKQGSGLKQKIFQWAVATGREGSKVRQRGDEPGGLLALKLKIADKLVFSKIKDRFGGRVRYFISGSAPLSRDIAEFFHACGILILEGYGLTESSAASFVNRPHKYAFGSVGMPMPGTELKIAPEDGEILMRSPGVMQGYHNLPEATAETLTPDGWLKTGDIGEVDAKGFLRITDRKKDLIKTSGGKYIAPQAIEGKLKATCPYISQVIVHGDKRNFVTALVTLDEEATMKWAKDNGFNGKPYSEIVMTPEAKKLLDPYFAEVNKTLAKYESVKQFAILPKDLTVDEGELTPSLKVKRKVVEKKYATLLDKMYEGSVADLG
ncbi:MAG TPA: long-chain fatty acid--CoA ligase [Kofleriaceae bacterium]|nr:long-chain fatty acid--CoA ligase [Kofleriaceae bacterium]